MDFTEFSGSDSPSEYVARVRIQMLIQDRNDIILAVSILNQYFVSRILEVLTELSQEFMEDRFPHLPDNGYISIHVS